MFLSVNELHCLNPKLTLAGLVHIACAKHDPDSGVSASGSTSALEIRAHFRLDRAGASIGPLLTRCPKLQKGKPSDGHRLDTTMGQVVTMNGVEPARFIWVAASAAMTM
jgi:hypothetical protein